MREKPTIDATDLLVISLCALGVVVSVGLETGDFTTAATSGVLFWIVELVIMAIAYAI